MTERNLVLLAYSSTDEHWFFLTKPVPQTFTSLLRGPGNLKGWRQVSLSFLDPLTQYTARCGRSCPARQEGNKSERVLQEFVVGELFLSIGLLDVILTSLPGRQTSLPHDVEENIPE